MIGAVLGRNFGRVKAFAEKFGAVKPMAHGKEKAAMNKAKVVNVVEPRKHLLPAAPELERLKLYRHMQHPVKIEPIVQVRVPEKPRNNRQAVKPRNIQAIPEKAIQKRPQYQRAINNPVRVRKNWQNNREDKNHTGQPFTKVQAESLNGQLFNAELINAVPASVFIQNGWSKEAVNKMPKIYREHPMSAAAKAELGLHGSVKQGHYFGEGSYGMVKLARVHLAGAAKPVLCVAKKINSDYMKLKDAFNEMRMQRQSGVTPKVYGIADAKAQNGDRRFIIFMAPAKGMDGDSFLQTHHHRMSNADKFTLLKEFAQKIQLMHKNGIYHRDLKLSNSSIDPKTLGVQILDFGIASKSKEAKAGERSEGPCYMAPEMIARGPYSHGFADMAKCDVYSLGVIFAQIFGSNSKDYLFTTRWDGRTLRNINSIVESALERVNIKNQAILSLVRDMLQKNPKNRPDMATVMTRLQQAKAGKAQPKQYREERNPINAAWNGAGLLGNYKARNAQKYNVLNDALNGHIDYNRYKKSKVPAYNYRGHNDLYDYYNAVRNRERFRHNN